MFGGISIYLSREHYSSCCWRRSTYAPRLRLLLSPSCCMFPAGAHSKKQIKRNRTHNTNLFPLIPATFHLRVFPCKLFFRSRSSMQTSHRLFFLPRHFISQTSFTNAILCANINRSLAGNGNVTVGQLDNEIHLIIVGFCCDASKKMKKKKRVDFISAHWRLFKKEIKWFLAN